MLIFRLACLSLALVKGKVNPFGKDLTRNARDFVSQYDYEYDLDDTDANSKKIQDASGETKIPLPGDLVDESKLIKIAKAEEDLIFPEDDYSYSYDTDDDESNEKSSAALNAPQNDLVNLAPLPQSDKNPNALLLSDVESGSENEEEQEVNLPVSISQQQQQQQNDLYTTAERAHRLLTSIIEISQKFFQHNEYALAIIQSLKVFNQEIANEIEAFVDQIENVGELLKQIEEFEDEKNREINWSVGDSFSVSFVWDKIYDEEIAAVDGVKKTLLSAGLRFGSNSDVDDASPSFSPDFDFPKPSIENYHDNKNMNYPNFFSFSLTQPYKGNDASFVLNSEGQISCLFLNDIDFLSELGLGCHDNHFHSQMNAIDSIPVGSYGWQNAFILQMHDSQQSLVNYGANYNDDWLKISYDVSFFADNIYFNNLFGWSQEEKTARSSVITDGQSSHVFFSSKWGTNGAININYPGSQQINQVIHPVSIIKDEIPLTVSGQVEATDNRYGMTITYDSVDQQPNGIILILDENGDPIAKQVEFNTIGRTNLNSSPEHWKSNLDKSINIQLLVYSIRQNPQGPNDYSCFVSSFISPKDYSDTCYLGIKIQPTANNQNFDKLEIRIRKGLEAYTDHFKQGQQQILSLGEIYFQVGQKYKSNLELEHNLESGFYEYNLGKIDYENKVKSSLMILRYADIETINAWIDTVVDNVIPYIWAIETFASKPGTILYGDRVILKLLPRSGQKFDLKIFTNAAQLGLTFPRCLIDPATDNLDAFEYIQFLFENSEKCADWVPADEFTDTVGKKIENFLQNFLKNWFFELKRLAYWIKVGRTQLVGSVDTIKLIYDRVSTRVVEFQSISGSSNKDSDNDNDYDSNEIQLQQQIKSQAQGVANLQQHYDLIVEYLENIIDFIFDALDESSRKQYVWQVRNDHQKCIKDIEWCRTRYFQNLEYLKHYFQGLIQKLQQEF